MSDVPIPAWTKAVTNAPTPRLPVIVTWHAFTIVSARLSGLRTDDVSPAGSPSAPLSSSSRLQNVEAFGSLLGEEIVSSFSRMLKSEQQPPGLVATSPPTTPKSVEADTLSTGTESSTGSNPNQTRCSDDVGGGGGVVAVPDQATGASLERLQECLRQNMERYACEALNTQNIARVVRELLSVHNVGQRLFARFVLGLSQGTVSELLSKPKPWDKLTEKGRDSYRKMHAWASDDFCVFMLKSLVPKKGASLSSSLAARFAFLRSPFPGLSQVLQDECT